jgi:hypothetical protein
MEFHSSPTPRDIADFAICMTIDPYLEQGLSDLQFVGAITSRISDPVARLTTAGRMIDGRDHAAAKRLLERAAVYAAFWGD